MQDLIEQEKFELEVLDKLNSARLLDPLIFGGGTMLRLCHGLNRYSIDLDFWLSEKIDPLELFQKIGSCLSRSYTMMDKANKHYTLLYEIRSREYPRSLKLEIRKDLKSVSVEPAIAYSHFSTTQVLVRAVSLRDMMSAKIEAFLDRNAVRDAFDIEFLLKKGIQLDAKAEVLRKILAILGQLTEKDFSVVLGSLLETEQRQYYVAKHFAILEAAIQEKLQ